MTWDGSLRAQVVEEFADANTRGPIAYDGEDGTLEDKLNAHADPMLAIAHAVIRRLEAIPAALRPKGCRHQVITCRCCGKRVERDARARYCSDHCRVEYNRPAKRAAQRGKNVGRKRCAGHDDRGRKCRHYPKKGRRLCPTHDRE